MNEVWDLSILYKDFDDPAFTGDMKALDEAIAAVNTLAGEAAGMEHSQLVHRFLQVQERVEELANKLFIFCSLRCSANTADTKANSLGDQLSAKLSGCAAANASLRRTVAELEDLDAIMDADPALEPYRFLLESIRRDSKYLLTDREEELFARMNISGASAWESLRDNLTSSVKVEYDGGITNLSAIRNLAYDPDPAVRKSAYEAELACYDKIKDSVAYALNSIKLQVINECQVRGYASPLDKALYQSRMKRETLALYHVNTLLTKTGPGRQGAQLRMGMYFALDRNYKGVLTIDGNNKDSIEDVPEFIAKLQEGYDFVQGSRFIRGGHAINTPPVRYAAVRLIHAPLVSLGAHQWFTDTTNAYRAYSREYLTHPDVRPLRDVFGGYELLAYLSIRATQLGLKACEVPVTRAYPATGKTPTKISGFKGNSDLMQVLLKALAGKYNP